MSIYKSRAITILQKKKNLSSEILLGFLLWNAYYIYLIIIKLKLRWGIGFKMKDFRFIFWKTFIDPTRFIKKYVLSFVLTSVFLNHPSKSHEILMVINQKALKTSVQT